MTRFQYASRLIMANLGGRIRPNFSPVDGGVTNPYLSYWIFSAQVKVAGDIDKHNA